MEHTQTQSEGNARDASAPSAPVRGTADAVPPGDATLRRLSYLAAITASFLGALVVAVSILGTFRSDIEFRRLVFHDHACAVLGFPISTLNSFVLVLVLQATSGPVEFKAFGVEFKGAGGPLVVYVFVFAVTVGAFKLLWG